MRITHLTAALVMAVSFSGQHLAGQNGQNHKRSEPRDYTFRNEPLNARGVRSLADLRGAPTIIEFWGVR